MARAPSTNIRLSLEEGRREREREGYMYMYTWERKRGIKGEKENLIEREREREGGREGGREKERDRDTCTYVISR